MKPPTGFLKWLHKTYSDDTAKFLIHTASISWTLASVANIVGISVNKELDPKEKKFLLPQEVADGATNIGLFYLITNTLTKGVEKLVDDGKIVFKSAKKLIGENGEAVLKKNGKAVFENIQQGTSEFRNARNGLGVVASVVGAVISSNILTPIVRGHYAAHKQKAMLKLESEGKIMPRSLPYFKQNSISPMPMSSFLAFTQRPGMKV